MSHKGTVPVISTKNAFENCQYAVEQCDLFLILITTHYDSGKTDAASRSITHEELLKTIELNKPRRASPSKPRKSRSRATSPQAGAQSR
jgi:hypothetical protein